MEWFTILAIVYLCVQFLLAISVALLNGPFLISFVKIRSLQTPSNTVLACLCSSDLLISVLTLFTWAYNIVLVSRETITHNLQVGIALGRVFLALVGLSSLFMTLVNFDRHAAICHPYKYMQHATPKLYAIVSVSASLVYILVITVSFTIDSIFQVYSTAVIVMTVTIATLSHLAYCTWEVFKVIHRHRREIGSCSQQCTGFQRETKRHHVIVLLIILFAVCKLPSMIPYILVVTGGVESDSPLLLLAMLSSLLMLVNGVINPFVYYFRITIFRNAVKDILCCQRPI